MATKSSGRRLVLDVNSLAIFLVEDHPGHPYIAPEMENGLKGQFTPILLDIIPLRTYWIMTRRWGCETVESERAIRHFLESYPTVEYDTLDKETVHIAFEVAHELRHDVFDSVYVSAALRLEATGIFTTDTDFKRLCGKKDLEYFNPVPPKVLERFEGFKKT